MFGASEIYQVAPEQVVTLTNRDRAPHHIRAASLAGANMGDFEVRPAQRIPVTLEPDASLELRLAFAPQAEGYRTANVAVLSPPLQDTRILVGGVGQGVQQAETSQSTNPKGGPQAPALPTPPDEPRALFEAAGLDVVRAERVTRAVNLEPGHGGAAAGDSPATVDAIDHVVIARRPR